MANHNGRFVIGFGGGRAAFALRATMDSDPLLITQRLGFEDSLPAMILLGGAAGMTPEHIAATQPLIESIVRYVDTGHIAVIDGGTDSGAMRMVGAARSTLRLRFPLVGIAPLAAVAYPGYENPDSKVALECGHSHFVLVEDGHFGDESELAAQIVHALSGYGHKPALALVVNGGPIVREEVLRFTTSPNLRLPVLVLEGSGRFADELAQALNTGDVQGDEQLEQMVKRGDIEAVPIDRGAEAVISHLDAIFR